MYQRDVKSQPDSAPAFRSAHSCSFCSEEGRKSSSDRSMTRNTRDMQELFLYPQRVLQPIPDRLCRIRAWKHFKHHLCGILPVSFPVFIDLTRTWGSSPGRYIGSARVSSHFFPGTRNGSASRTGTPSPEPAEPLYKEGRGRFFIRAFGSLVFYCKRSLKHPNDLRNSLSPVA